jgi:hypothetical protein
MIRLAIGQEVHHRELRQDCPNFPFPPMREPPLLRFQVPQKLTLRLMFEKRMSKDALGNSNRGNLADAPVVPGNSRGIARTFRKCASQLVAGQDLTVHTQHCK